MSEPSHPNYRLQDLQRRWERDPGSRVYQQLADEYRKAGQLVEAAVVLEDGLGHRPNDIAGRVALGRCRLDLGQIPEAIEALQNVISRDAAHHVANKLLLDAYLKAGDLVQARERLTIYRLINDRDPEIEDLDARLQQLESGHSAAMAKARQTQPPSRQPERAESSGGEPIAERPEAPASERPTLVGMASRSAASPVETPDELGGESIDATAVTVESSRRSSPVVPAPRGTVAAVGPQSPTVQEESSKAVVQNSPEEFSNMSNHAPDPKVNDVFDFGQEAQPLDAFGALWAELEESVALPSAVSAPQISTPQIQAPEPASASPSDEPFGDLFATPAVDAAAAASVDLWQDLAKDLPAAAVVTSAPRAAESTIPRPAIEEVSAPEPAVEEVEVRDDPEEPAADPLLAEAPTTEAMGDFLNAPTIPIPSPAPSRPLEDEGPESDDEDPWATPDTETADAAIVDEDAAPTVTLGSLYLKQGHHEEAARIFEEILRKEPGHQAALAGLNLARKPDSSGLSAMDLLADQSLIGAAPTEVTTQKILVLTNYLQHLKARSKESHVH